ncbi:ABC transporter substrate-binding protein [Streptomyces tateyamensis]|uniref:ABC transporter substrate-binding protein n=1 Tax=Streptomyces tateyamensis TaxID=565073 RepID=A0A2V4NEN4_9ACTN|nr:extracellular solute-binding protein [Streptomyces tateyamensis]PYC78705.1 ABC transporter substrate-binding protein [Streptomyces tateyamensis]
MNRRLLTALAVTLTAGLVTGGWIYARSDSDPVPSGTITLVAADYGSAGANPSQAYWDGMAAAFHRVHPHVTVRVQVYDWNDIGARLDEMVRNKQYPDIVEGPSSAAWAKQGLLYPAYQVSGDGAVQMRLVPSLQATGGGDLTATALPFVSSSRAFLINNKLWQQAGLPTAQGKAVAPRTWAELEQDARRMKAAGVPVPLGLPLGPEEAQGELFMWEMNNRGGYADPSGAWTVDSPQNRATLAQLKHWVDAGLTEHAPASVNRTALYADFAAGRVGMLNGTPIQLADVAHNGLDVTWAPLPSAQEGQVPQTLGVADWISAFRPGGHQRQIDAFLEFAYQKQWQVAFAKEYDLLPVTLDALDQTRADQPELAPFIDALSAAQFLPADLPGWSAVQKAIQSGAGRLLEDPQGLSDIQRTAAQGAH